MTCVHVSVRTTCVNAHAAVVCVTVLVIDASTYCCHRCELFW